MFWRRGKLIAILDKTKSKSAWTYHIFNCCIQLSNNIIRIQLGIRIKEQISLFSDTFETFLSIDLSSFKRVARNGNGRNAEKNEKLTLLLSCMYIMGYYNFDN